MPILWHTCWFMHKWTFADIYLKLGMTGDFWNKKTAETVSSKKTRIAELNFFLLLDCPQTTLGHFWGHNLMHLMLINACFLSWPEGHYQPCNKVRSSPTKNKMGFDQQNSTLCINPLNYSSQNCSGKMPFEIMQNKPIQHFPAYFEK